MSERRDPSQYQTKVDGRWTTVDKMTEDQAKQELCAMYDAIDGVEEIIRGAADSVRVLADGDLRPLPSAPR